MTLVKNYKEQLKKYDKITVEFGNCDRCVFDERPPRTGGVSCKLGAKEEYDYKKLGCSSSNNYYNFIKKPLSKLLRKL